MGKVVITDYTFPSLDIEESILNAAGHQLVAVQEKSARGLIDIVADADAVITQFASVDASVVDAMREAKVIVRYGIGFDNVDCDAAREKGIPVCNIPHFCLDEVADHTLGFILSMTRNLRANCSHMLAGDWGLAVDITEMRCLRDLTVGIIGLGNIGREVANRLSAFKCRLVASDPVTSEADAALHGCQLVELDELLTTSDVVTLHCPATPSTKGIINSRTIAKMKNRAILINVGRGELVELAAVQSALQSGHLSGAALDVFETEPLGNSPLLAMNNVITSSHIASASLNARTTLQESAAKLAVAALNGESLPSIVNGL